MSKNDILYMKKPASWYGDMAREGIALGNGKTGALVLGGIGIEEIVFNRADMWMNYKHGDLPRLDGVLEKMRETIDSGDYVKANTMLYDALVSKGYDSWTGVPAILGSLKIEFDTESLFTNYRRILYMDKAECEVRYTQSSKNVSRRSFISRRDDTFYFEFTANEDTTAHISFDIFDDRTPNTDKLREETKDSRKIGYKDNGIDYSLKTQYYDCGAKIRVFGAETVIEKGILKVCGKTFRIAVKCCSGNRSIKKLTEPVDFCYEEKLKEHVSLHKKLYNTARAKAERTKSF